MITQVEILVGLIPFIPAFMGFLVSIIYVLTRSRALVFSSTILALLLVTAFSTIVAVSVFQEHQVVVFRAAGWPAPIGIVYMVDMPTAILLVVTSFILLAIAIYSTDYIVDQGYPWYSILLLGASSGILGVICTGDMFNLFVMLEVTAISSYALVMYYMNRADSIVSGLKYAFIGALGTTLYLLAMGITYSVFGTLNFADLSQKLRSPMDTTLVYVAYGLIMLVSFWAFSIKSGVFPNHFWLPDAHPAAPTPISALLSGLVVNTGVIGLYKFIYIASWSTPSSPLPPAIGSAKYFVSLLAIATGVVSAIIGALLMYIQTDVKRLIAYSTVMNLGYLFMAAGCANEKGLNALLFYMTMHSLAKATLFLSAGVFIQAAGTRNLEKLAGLGTRYRVAGLSLVLSVLTLAGVPPLPGFLAKLLLYEALFEYNIAFAIAMVVASAIGLISYMKMLYVILLGLRVVEPAEVRMPLANLALVILVAFIVFGIAFLASPWLLRVIYIRASEQLTMNIESYIAKLEQFILRPS
ncbi:MAG: proton-conducting transporter membrane subunit [Desulfurococcaceae archaeon]